MKVRVLAGGATMIDTSTGTLRVTPVPEVDADVPTAASGGVAAGLGTNQVAADDRYDAALICNPVRTAAGVRWLSTLRRSALTCCPDDEQTQAILRQMGFAKIKALLSGVGIRMGGTTIMFVRAQQDRGAASCVVRTEDGTVWHHAGGWPSAAAARVVKRHCGDVDLVITSVPEHGLVLDERQSTTTGAASDSYDELLRGLDTAAPAAVGVIQPESGSARRATGYGWSVTPERIAWDTGHLGVNAFVCRGGDALEVSARACRYMPAANVAGAVRGRLDRPDGALTLQPAVDAQLKVLADEVMKRRLPKWLAAHPVDAQLLSQWQVNYQVIVAGDAQSYAYHVDLRHAPWEVADGYSARPSMGSRISARGLRGLETLSLEWSDLAHGGDYAHWRHLYRVEPHSVIYPKWECIQDPLKRMFPETLITKRAVDREVERWARHQVAGIE